MNKEHRMMNNEVFYLFLRLRISIKLKRVEFGIGRKARI